jgi:RES domain-containing protein
LSQVVTRIYRVLRKPYAQNPFDGEGAYRFGGRWSSSGTRLSYASEHQSLAMLEYFIHLDKDNPPDDLVLAIAELPESLSKKILAIEDLYMNWRDAIAPPDLARFGDEFAAQANHCALFVPSALAPREHNCLLNPAHPDFKNIAVRPLEALNYDPRMFNKSRAHRGR